VNVDRLPGHRWLVVEIVRRESRWTSADATPARKLVRSIIRQRRRTSSFGFLKRGGLS
jgi:hypothetical protein